MKILKQFLTAYKRRKESLKKEIALLEGGQLFTGEKREPAPWEDTTKKRLEHAKEDLANIERLIKKAKAKLAK